MKKGLVKILLIVNIALSPLVILANGKGTKKKDNAKGTAIAITAPMEGPLSYAKIKLVKEGSKDTLEYQTNFMGMANYNFSIGNPTKYVAIISPGMDSISMKKGDQFKPYKSEFIANPGKNPLIYLMKKH